MTDDPIAAVRGRMEQFLEAVEACVGALPALVGSYRRGEATFHERVTALERRESDCNEAARELRSALADSLAAESFFHPTGDLVSLVTAVDAVANRAERVATELSAVEPPLEGRPGEALARMADLAVEAFDALAEAVVAYFETLESGIDAGADPGPTLERVRRLESDCDDHRQDAVRAAFGAEPTADALSMRVVLHEMDAVVDGMETAADTLDVVSRTPI
jgi:uncharacterized protein Yka (UPF0111/DUF47 family)